MLYYFNVLTYVNIYTRFEHCNLFIHDIYNYS